MSKILVVALLGLVGSLSCIALADDAPPMLIVTNLSHLAAVVEADGGNACTLYAGFAEGDNEYNYECYYTPDMDACHAMPSNGAGYTCVKLDLSKTDHEVVVTVSGKKLSTTAHLVHRKQSSIVPCQTLPDHEVAYCSISQDKDGRPTLSCK